MALITCCHTCAFIALGQGQQDSPGKNKVQKVHCVIDFGHNPSTNEEQSVTCLQNDHVTNAT